MRSGERNENGEMKVTGNLEIMVKGKRYYSGWSDVGILCA